jgi:hypothetical protein
VRTDASTHHQLLQKSRFSNIQMHMGFKEKKIFVDGQIDNIHDAIS